MAIESEKNFIQEENLQLAIERTQLATERTQLAAERTFLAWLRTGLGGVASGVAIAKLVLFHTLEHQRIAQTIGNALILWGIVVFLLGFNSYRRSCLRRQGAIAYRLHLLQAGAIAISLILFASILLGILLA